MNRDEIKQAFATILTLAGKIDANQQKVNFMHFMHGRADDAFHWQGFVDEQRVRIKKMQDDFFEKTKNVSPEVMGEIAMEVATGR